MLRIEYPPNSDEFVTITPLQLANLIIDGYVSPETIVQPFVVPVPGSDQYTEESGRLEDMLSATHFDVLSECLLTRVHELYDPPASAWSPQDWIFDQPDAGQSPFANRGFVQPDFRQFASEQERGAAAGASRHLAGLRPPSELIGTAMMGLEWLEARAEHLATKWNWQQFQWFRDRLLWLSAWLASLSGKRAVAIERYERFLAEAAKEERPKRRQKQEVADGEEEKDAEPLWFPTKDPQLWMLAYNNLAVLLLQQATDTPRDKEHEALEFLVQLAIWEALPAACLSLSNAIDLAWQRRRRILFHDSIDHLVDKHVRRLMEIASVRPTPRRKQAAEIWKEIYYGSKGGDRPFEGFVPDNPRTDIRQHVRTETVIAPLVKVAYHVRNPESRFPQPDPKSPNLNPVRQELQLWPTPISVLWKAPPQPVKVPNIIKRHRIYAEAASILYPRDIYPGGRRGGDASLAAAPPGSPSEKAIRDVNRLIDQGRLDQAESRIEELEAAR